MTGDRPRNRALDSVKGIAVLLVVFGHYIPASSPDYWRWFAGSFIYSFHMPVFFIISGYLFGRGRQPLGPRAVLRFSGKKAQRLMVPFLCVAFLYLFIKLPAQFFFTMSMPVSLDSFWILLEDPGHFYAPFLWFLETLFLIFVLFVLLLQVVRNKYFLALLLCGTPFFIPYVETPIVVLVCQHMPAFCLGVLLSRFSTERTEAISASAGAACFFFLATTFFYLGPEYLGVYALAANGLAMTGLFLFILRLVPERVSGVFGIFGLYGSSIYLLHFPFEACVKKISDQLFHAPQSSFWLFAVPAIVLSMVMPIVIEQGFLQKSQRLLMWLIGESPSDKTGYLYRVLGLWRIDDEKVLANSAKGGPGG